VGSGPVARRMEEEDYGPRINTDWHGFLDVGLTGGCVELFGY